MKTAQNLRIGHINIRSLTPNLSDFDQFVNSENFDFIGISETWLNDNSLDTNVGVYGYHGIFQNRKSRGGGVGLFIKQGYKFTRMENELTSNEHFEQIWIKVQMGKSEFILGCIYKPPHYRQSDFLVEFDDILSSFVPLCDRICCVGDFNIDYMDSLSKEVMEFNSVLESANLSQIVPHPTRITTQSSSLIDLIIISNNIKIFECDTLPFQFSDHEFIYCEVEIPSITKVIKYKEIRNWSDINISQFEQDLKSIPWRNIYDMNDIDRKVDFITESLNILLDLHAPKRTVRLTKRNRQPWLKNVINLIKMRNKALSKYKKAVLILIELITNHLGT